VARTPTHNHLDRRVRDRGTCPGCDVFWKAQDDRLTNVRTNSAERQIEALSEREVARWQTLRWCTAILDVPPLEHVTNGCDTHACDQRPDHDGDHHCGVCGTTWRSRIARRR